MRIWSVHPRQLDSKGLVACWRETLLAKHVLEGKTKGYKNHPQLLRFKEHKEPLAAINTYLEALAAEAKHRGYNFDETKIGAARTTKSIPLNTAQLFFEYEHLLKKTSARDHTHFEQLKNQQPEHHPLFVLREGPVEDWEKTEHD